MPSKDSTAIGVRIDNEVIAKIRQRANRHGWSFNRWMNWAVFNGLRSHKKERPANEQ